MSFHSSDPEDYRRFGQSIGGQRSIEKEEMSSDSPNGQAIQNARSMRMQLPPVPYNPNSFVPLSVLLEFAIQKAYHDLIILTDL